MTFSIALAQAPARRTTHEGVYTSAQAARGQAIFASTCSGCHGAALGGGEFEGDDVPALKREDLFQAGDLGGFFSRLKRAMPRDAPGSLSDATYVDVIAFLLSENKIPAGSTELPANLEGLAAIRIVREGPAPNFSLVQVVGCLTAGANNTLALTRGSDPLVTANAKATPAELEEAKAQALGTESFRLMNITGVPGAMPGSRIEARGLLVRMPNDNRINVTTVVALGASCTP